MMKDFDQLNESHEPLDLWASSCCDEVHQEK